MKKLSILLCVLGLMAIVILAACNTPDGNSTETDTTIESDSTTESVTNDETETEGETWPTETSDPEVVSVVEGKVRVVLYSHTLLRVEVAKNGSFEDRPTFAVTGRDDFEGIAPEWVIRTETDDAITMQTPRFTVSIKKNAASAEDVTIVNAAGKSLWTQTDFTTDALYLPEPYATPDVWGFNDVRRLVKAEDAYTPNGEQNNGWSYTPNARDYYIFFPMGDSKQLLSDFNKLTGACEMVPIKTLGLWFSRFSDLSAQDFYDLIDRYYDNGFPLDVIVADTHWKAGHSTGYEVNTDLFPANIGEFFSTANEKGVLTLLNDHVRDYDGSLLDEAQLTWFGTNLQQKLADGLDAWWYDRNWSYYLESPFRGYHGDLLGQDMYYTLTDAVNGNDRTWMLSNVYWILHGSISEPPHVSSHRYSLQWSGDIQCDSGALQTELKNAVYAGASAAMPYIVSDIGGHHGKPSEDLYIRWVQYGSLSSIMRFHANAYDRSPWATGETAVEVSRVYLNMRYRLMPLYYSLVRDNYDTGMPIMKRLDFEYPQYEEARRNDQYLLGDNVLVAPLTTTFASVGTAVPATWLTSPSGAMGLYAEYFNNARLMGDPVITRVDPSPDFEWGNGSPFTDDKTDVTPFSIRWSGKLTNKSQTPICLASLSDDGFRVIVNGKTVIDNWDNPDSWMVANKQFTIAPGETVDIVVEYCEVSGSARAHLNYLPILAADGSEYQDQREVFIPDGTWMDVWSGKTYTGPKTVTVGHSEYTSPIFVKLGSFTVLADNAQNLSTSDWHSLAIDMYPGEGSFSYDLYEDDGVTEDYMDGLYRTTPMSMTTAGKTSTIKVAAAEGAYKTDFTSRTYVLRVHEVDGYTVSGITVNGQSVNFTRIEQADAYTENGGLPFSFDGAACDSDVVTITFTADLDAQSEIVVNYK